MLAVTVIMPVYDAMPYLPEAIDSILNQTLRDFTYLIINDGSTDASEEYLNQLNDQRIQVVHRPHRGLGATLNTGVAMCKTEFLARMDADDVALPTRLEVQMNYLCQNKDVGIVGVLPAYFGENRRGFSLSMPCDHESIYAELLNGRHAFCHATMMCRTSILREIGGYRIQGIGEDWDMLLRMGDATRMANLNEVLYLWRVHAGSVNVKHLALIRKECGYACHCAKRRAEGQPEISFDAFLVEQRSRALWQRVAEIIDLYALAQYRSALAEILDSNWAGVGYVRLAWAALCSPGRTSRRISRAIWKHRKS